MTEHPITKRVRTPGAAGNNLAGSPANFGTGVIRACGGIVLASARGSECLCDSEAPDDWRPKIVHQPRQQMNPVRRASTYLLVLLAVLLAGVTPARTTPGTDWNAGDVFVGLGGPEAFSDPALAAYLGTYRVLDQHGGLREDVRFRSGGITTECAVDPATGRLWATSFLENVVEQLDDLHDSKGAHNVLSSIDTARYGTAAIESIVFDRDGNFYVGAPDEQTDLRSGRDAFGLLLKFSRDGRLLASYSLPVNTYPQGYAPPPHEVPRGIDWFDIATNGVIFYTSEDRFIRTWDLINDAPGPGNEIAVRNANGTLVETYGATAGVFARVPDEETRALRLLPPGDGTAGGLLVATASAVRRLDGSGRELTNYFVPATSGYFAINLSPDAQYVWTATTVGAALMKFHLATGRPMNISPAPILVQVAQGQTATVFDRIRFPATPYGLCVKLEYTAQTVDCSASPASSVCTRVESCSAASAGDDDGDGLADDADPDCDPPAPQVHVGDQVSRGGVAVSLPLPAKDADGDLLTYSEVTLPSWLMLSPDRGVLTGTTPAVSAETPYDVALRASDGAATAVLQLTWTVVPNVNTPPGCSAAAAAPAVIWPPDHTMVRVAIAGVFDPDGGTPAVTITKIEQNEPTTGKGAGNTSVDGMLDGTTAFVRAERSGKGRSRVYRIGFSATDASAASCSGQVFVVVPHDPANTAVPAVAEGAWRDSTKPD